MSDFYQQEFTWGAGPQTVHVAGGFNNWSPTASPLHRQEDGSFRAHIPLPWGEKQAYKYIVDGDWMVREDEAKEWDAAGNHNNIFTAPAKPLTSPSSETTRPNELLAASAPGTVTGQTQSPPVSPRDASSSGFSSATSGAPAGYVAAGLAAIGLGGGAAAAANKDKDAAVVPVSATTETTGPVTTTTETIVVEEVDESKLSKKEKEKLRKARQKARKRAGGGGAGSEDDVSSSGAVTPALDSATTNKELQAGTDSGDIEVLGDNQQQPGIGEKISTGAAAIGGAAAGAIAGGLGAAALGIKKVTGVDPTLSQEAKDAAPQDAPGANLAASRPANDRNASITAIPPSTATGGAAVPAAAVPSTATSYNASSDATAPGTTIQDSTTGHHEQAGIAGKAAALGAGAAGIVGAGFAAVHKATGLDVAPQGKPISVEDARARGIDVKSIPHIDAPTDAAKTSSSPPEGAVNQLQEIVDGLKKDGTPATFAPGAGFTGANAANASSAPSTDERATAKRHENADPVPGTAAGLLKDDTFGPGNPSGPATYGAPGLDKGIAPSNPVGLGGPNLAASSTSDLPSQAEAAAENNKTVPAPRITALNSPVGGSPRHRRSGSSARNSLSPVQSNLSLNNQPTSPTSPGGRQGSSLAAGATGAAVGGAAGAAAASAFSDSHGQVRTQGQVVGSETDAQGRPIGDVAQRNLATGGTQQPHAVGHGAPTGTASSNAPGTLPSGTAPTATVSGPVGATNASPDVRAPITPSDRPADSTGHSTAIGAGAAGVGAAALGAAALGRNGHKSEAPGTAQPLDLPKNTTVDKLDVPKNAGANIDPKKEQKERRRSSMFGLFKKKDRTPSFSEEIKSPKDGIAAHQHTTAPGAAGAGASTGTGPHVETTATHPAVVTGPTGSTSGPGAGAAGVGAGTAAAGAAAALGASHSGAHTGPGATTGTGSHAGGLTGSNVPSTGTASHAGPNVGAVGTSHTGTGAGTGLASGQQQSHIGTGPTSHSGPGVGAGLTSGQQQSHLGTGSAVGTGPTSGLGSTTGPSATHTGPNDQNRSHSGVGTGAGVGAGIAGAAAATGAALGLGHKDSQRDHVPSSQGVATGTGAGLSGSSAPAHTAGQGYTNTTAGVTGMPASHSVDSPAAVAGLNTNNEAPTSFAEREMGRATGLTSPVTGSGREAVAYGKDGVSSGTQFGKDGVATGTHLGQNTLSTGANAGQQGLSGLTGAGKAGTAAVGTGVTGAAGTGTGFIKESGAKITGHGVPGTAPSTPSKNAAAGAASTPATPHSHAGHDGVKKRKSGFFHKLKVALTGKKE